MVQPVWGTTEEHHIQQVNCLGKPPQNDLLSVMDL